MAKAAGSGVWRAGWPLSATPCTPAPQAGGSRLWAPPQGPVGAGGPGPCGSTCAGEASARGAFARPGCARHPWAPPGVAPGLLRLAPSPPSATNKAKTHSKRAGDSRLACLPAGTSSGSARMLCGTGAMPVTRLSPWGAGHLRTHLPAQPCLPKGEAFPCRRPWPVFPEAGKRGGRNALFRAQEDEY